jgi:hypothetical protein
MYCTPAYTAKIAQIAAASFATLARAPMPPQMATASGPAMGPWTLGWSAPASGLAADHYVIAARAATENFYRARVPVAATTRTIGAAELGIDAAAAFYVSVASVDARGHESLFAYPEYRCDAAGCVVPAGSLDVTVKR